MKIYTKKGDRGETSLIGGTRVPKSHVRIVAYGTVDELNAHIGVVRGGLPVDGAEAEFLGDIQNELFVIGGLLAADPVKNRMELPQLDKASIGRMEGAIDGMNEALEELRAFILPAGHVAVAQCHVARTVCRRAERAVVRLDEASGEHGVDPLILEYLNRLSDYLFVLARKIAHDLGVTEVPWAPRKSNG